MKILGVVSIFLALSVISLPTAYAQSPQLISVGLHTAYIPTGFDDNDKVSFMVEGLFMDSCSKTAGVDIAVNNNEVVITQKALRYPGPCLDMLVRYYQPIELREVLGSGSYRVTDGATGKSLGHIGVIRARTPNADDYLYAPVSDAWVLRGSDRKDKIVLNGVFTNNCVSLQNVRIMVDDDVISVLPIAQQESRPDCHSGNFPYQFVQTYPRPTKGRYLLYVRSLEGLAIQKVIDVY